LNYRMLSYITGRVILISAALMSLPLTVAVIYRETAPLLSFLGTMAIMAAFGVPLAFLVKVKRKTFFAKEGLVCVSLAWTLLSLFGALPLVFSGAVGNYVDAFFEIVSGYTTTGATILTEIETLPKSILFWRSFTHWIGGMGVLVFMLAIVQKTDMGMMHILKAEAPGPKVGKLVSKTASSARILYGIYLALTVVMTILLICGGMPVFDSIVNSFATAGTGGFGILSDSIAGYNNVFCEMVIAVFMFLFGVNFNMYYFVIIGEFRRVMKSDELKWYFAIVAGATVAVSLNIMSVYGDPGSSFRYGFFQVSSIISTTGFSTANFDLWPSFSKVVLVLLMFIGSCAGSTGGGIKVARIVIIFKSVRNAVRKMVYPRSVSTVKLDGEIIDDRTVRAVGTYLCAYVIIMCASTLVVALDKYDGVTSFTSVMACLNNIGPALGAAGPAENFSGFGIVSKLVLILDMLLGRLEIYPVLTLLSVSAWKKN